MDEESPPRTHVSDVGSSMSDMSVSETESDRDSPINTRANTGGLDQTIFGDLDKLGPRALLAKMCTHVLKANPDVPPPWVGLESMNEKMAELFAAAEWKEINGILEAKAAYEVPLDEVPKGTKILDTLTVRDIKQNGPKKGKPKVRVCVNGKGMTEEHYSRAHSPTIQFVSIRTIFGVSAATGAKLRGGDFGQAYLNADNEKLIYSYPPKSARQHDEKGRRLVWAIPKALYGGKASGRQWYKLLRAKLVDIRARLHRIRVGSVRLYP